MDTSSIVSVAIQEFIRDTSTDKEEISRTPLPESRRRYNRSSHIINNKNLKVEKSLRVLKLNNPGYLKELTIVADQKINLFIVIDGRDLFGVHSSFDSLSAITLYSDTVTARHDDDSYVVNIKSISFKDNIDVKAVFDSSAIITNIFGAYDVCEVI